MASQFTERELDIMSVLWDRASATAAEVRAALDDALAHNTVLTILKILEDKGHVRRAEEGRAHRYYPLIERHQAKSNAVRRLIDRLFEGEPRLLATQLVDDRNLTDDDLRELRERLTQRLRDRGRVARAPKGRRK